MPTYNPAPIFDTIRPWLDNDGFGKAGRIQALDAAIASAFGVPTVRPKIGLTEADFRGAANQLGGTFAQMRAVWETECLGSGWFTDVRADILMQDGKGGFIDGSELLKILFESKWFHHFTGGKYDNQYPNLSTKIWTRSTYIGGQGEWTRLYNAMQLDRNAALLSASVGGPQIMGFNFKKAGYDSVEGFWEGMKSGDQAHLDAFVSFIKNSYLVTAFRKISNVHADCVPFAHGYNGSGFRANGYHITIAKSHSKYS